MICPTCGVDNPPEVTKCECGTEKIICCPKCKERNRISRTNCKICGFKLKKETPVISDLGEEELVKCSKCGSKQLTANKQGYGWKKGIGVAVCTIGIGALAGFINSSKIWITCLKCGHRWKAGER